MATRTCLRERRWRARRYTTRHRAPAVGLETSKQEIERALSRLCGTLLIAGSDDLVARVVASISDPKKGIQQAMANQSKHDHDDELAGRGSADGRVSDDQTLQLREEELRARKESVETGRVRLGTDVVEEQQTLEVPVAREEVTIERHPVDRRPTEGSIEDSNQTIRVPVHEEQVQLDKEAVVTEEIRIGKRQVQETERVTGTVRREEARIEREGDVDIKDRS
jgi:uncharacterized protein (TIGR02271 family)